LSKRAPNWKLPCILRTSLPYFFVFAELSVQSGAQPQVPPQNSRSDAESAAEENIPEISFHDTPLTFHSRIDLVIVPVVVRDREGRAVGNLRQDDFRLFDNGKPQLISRFSVENSVESGRQADRRAEVVAAEIPVREAPPPPARPERYTAYLFDDVHFEFGDLVRVREAARNHLASLPSTARAGIFSTSGQTTLDFTGDHDKWNEALSELRPRPIARSKSGCPDLTYYTADLIVNKHDPEPLEAATKEVVACQHLPNPRGFSPAQQAALAAATMELNAGNHESRVSLGVLQSLVRRMFALRGDRNIILVSPGFFTAFDLQPYKTEIVDLAIRANVVISALDGRGLYAVVPGGDVGRRAYDIDAEKMKLAYQSQEAFVQDEVLRELVDGTGGIFFHNSNDMAAGFRSVPARPDFSYTLGFSPQNLKPDGSFHQLKVTLKDHPGKLNVQARRGYVAPRPGPKSAKQEIEDALWSRKEINDLPVELETQVSRLDHKGAQIAVLARVNLKKLHFRTADGRHCNDLTVAVSMFDRKGNYLTGIEETLEMRFKEETFTAKLGGPPVTLTTKFDVTPGSYLVRLVARDTERHLMSVKNANVDIP
jgi:VWFA-related protein